MTILLQCPPPPTGRPSLGDRPPPPPGRPSGARRGDSKGRRSGGAEVRKAPMVPLTRIFCADVCLPSVTCTPHVSVQGYLFLATPSGVRTRDPSPPSAQAPLSNSNNGHSWPVTTEKRPTSPRHTVSPVVAEAGGGGTRRDGGTSWPQRGPGQQRLPRVHGGPLNMGTAQSPQRPEAGGQVSLVCRADTGGGGWLKK